MQASDVSEAPLAMYEPGELGMHGFSGEAILTSAKFNHY